MDLVVHGTIISLFIVVCISLHGVGKKGKKKKKERVGGEGKENEVTNGWGGGGEKWEGEKE